jgi:hypothetical protein
MMPTDSYHQSVVDDESTRLSDKLNEIYKKFDTVQEAYQHIEQQEQELNEAQSSKQDLSCLPTLSVKDIPRTKPKKQVEHSKIESVSTQWRLAPTNGLTYIRMVNILENLPDELQELMPLFSDCLMRLGTKGMTMEQLEDQIKMKTGGISASYLSTTSPFDINKWEQGFELSGYAFDRNIPALYDLMRTIVLETNFDSPAAEANIKELLLATASTATDSITESGHSYAKSYALAGLTPAYRAKENVSGLSQLYFTIQLLQDPKSFNNLIEKLKRIQSIALSKSDKLRVAITCGPEARSANEGNLNQFLSTLPKASSIPQATAKYSSRINLGHSKAFLRLPSQVSFVGLAVPGVEYVNKSGAALSILSQLLTHKHLHQEIREKGGAYGAGASSHGLGGVFAMTSYRDPVPGRSVKLMRNAGEWAVTNEFSATDLEEAKLSVFKGLDALEDIHYEGMLQFLNGIDPEMEQRRREQLLDVNVHDVKIAAQKFLVDGMANSRTMVIGSKAPSHELDWKEVAKPIRI